MLILDTQEPSDSAGGHLKGRIVSLGPQVPGIPKMVHCAKLWPGTVRHGSVADMEERHDGLARSGNTLGLCATSTLILRNRWRGKSKTCGPTTVHSMATVVCYLPSSCW